MAAITPRRILLGLLVLIALAAVLVVIDGFAARSHLSSASEHAEAALSRLTQGEPADEALAKGQAEVDAAASRVDGPLWTLGSRIPLLGRSLGMARDGVALTDAAMAVGRQAAEQASMLLGDGLGMSAQDGQVDLAPLDQARTALAAIDVTELRTVRDRLAGRSRSLVPRLIRDGVAAALSGADRALKLHDDAGRLTDLLPRLLGQDEERRYLVAIQTNAELRGTGGLIGFVTVLTVDDGRFTLAPPVVHEAIGEDIAGESFVAPGFGQGPDPAPADPDFEARYGHVAASRLLSNVNVDPDAPTTSQVLLDLYAARTGVELDGVLLVDPIALEEMLLVAGPVELPEDARSHPDIPPVIPAEQVAEWSMHRVYELVGDGFTSEREAFLTGFGLGMFQQVFSGSWDGVGMARAIALAVSERHLQVYSTDESDQGLVEALGAGGSLVQQSNSGEAGAAPPDLLAVVANNAVGGKMDVHLGHAFTGTVQLRETSDGWVRDLGLRVEVDNPLPASGMDTYIIGNCLVTELRNQCFEGPPGVNRTWWTVWSGESTAVNDLTGGDGREGRWRSSQLHGLRAIDHYLETPPESVAGFDIELSTPIDVTDGRYRLVLWRQAKAIPDRWDLVILPPDGRAIEVEAVGGGRGTGMGADPGGDQIRATRNDDGSWQITGHATTDVTIWVRWS